MYVYVEKINDNKYYRGFGEIKSNTYENIETNSTPVEDIKEKKQYYKIKEITTYKTQKVNNVDRFGNIINSYEINIPSKAYGWEFDELAWNSSGVIVEPSNKEKIEDLQEENQQLTNRVSVLQESNAEKDLEIDALNNQTVEMSDLILDLSMKILN